MTNDSPSQEWLRKMADAEDGCEGSSVGGLAHQLGVLPLSFADSAQLTRSAFSKLIVLSRKGRGLSREQLAKEADVEVGELEGIENDLLASPEPRTIHKLAQILKLPEARLLELSGLVQRKDHLLDEPAIRFAACSGTMENLTPDEKRALQQFVKTLSKLSDGG